MNKTRTMSVMLALFGFLLACCMTLQAHAGTSVVVNKGWFAPKGNGAFSAVAKNACRSVATTPSDLITHSPDGKKKIVGRRADDGAQSFVVDVSGKKFAIQTEAWPCPEMGWSAGSDHFFVNYSDGGNVGTYHVAVYGLAKGKLAQIPLTRMVRQDFLSGYPKCFESEEPNIMGVAWSDDASRLLMAAQVLPHSNCDNMGTFKLYELAVPSGAIIRRFSQAQAKTSFRELLGPALGSADDHCFSEPGSCAIPMLHTSDDTHTVQ